MTKPSTTPDVFRLSGADLRSLAANGRTKAGKAARLELERRSAGKVTEAPAPVVEAEVVDPVKVARKAATEAATAFANAQPGGFSLKAMIRERTRLLAEAGLITAS